MAEPRTTCSRCGEPREPQSFHQYYCLTCVRSLQKKYRDNRPPRETCTRCGEPRGDSSSPSYCRPCHRALGRESRERRGGKKPQENCSRCGQERDGRHPSYCRACWQGPIREERLAAPCTTCGGAKDQRHEYYCKRCAQDIWLRREFGITADQWEAKFAEQGGVCGICKGGPGETNDGRIREWHTDHDHETGRFRGVLCASCNIGIGHFGDDVGRLLAAADYIERARLT
jgi:hypothetical protein